MELMPFSFSLGDVGACDSVSVSEAGGSSASSSEAFPSSDSSVGEVRSDAASLLLSGCSG